jgi:hypothetical protein
MDFLTAILALVVAVVGSTTQDMAMTSNADGSITVVAADGSETTISADGYHSEMKSADGKKVMATTVSEDGTTTTKTNNNRTVVVATATAAPTGRSPTISPTWPRANVPTASVPTTSPTKPPKYLRASDWAGCCFVFTQSKLSPTQATLVTNHDVNQEQCSKNGANTAGDSHQEVR